MSLLRKYVLPVTPSIEVVTLREFCISEVVDELVPLYDEKGIKVSEQRVSKSVRKVIDPDVISHKGLDSDLFSLQNQIDSGVSLSPFTGTFISSDLGSSSRTGSDVISSIESFVSNPDNHVQQSNND